MWVARVELGFGPRHGRDVCCSGARDPPAEIPNPVIDACGLLQREKGPPWKSPTLWCSGSLTLPLYQLFLLLSSYSKTFFFEERIRCI